MAAFPNPDSRAPRSGGVRFAPSPTGHFHIGNLRTAWISHSLASKLLLPWTVRYEDIDRPRVQTWARTAQTNDLAALGLRPDLELLQSDFESRHWNLLLLAIGQGRVYPCDCSRREVQSALLALASAPHEMNAAVYSGHCRALPHDRQMRETSSVAWRFRSELGSGREDFIIARSSGDLLHGLPRRESFVPAYHWACAIDDYDGNYDWLVRSRDLAPAADLQRSIHSWLEQADGAREKPRIFHTALVVDEDGHRLEKRTKGVTLPELRDRGLNERTLLEKFEVSFPGFDLSTPGDSQETLTLKVSEILR